MDDPAVRSGNASRRSWFLQTLREPGTRHAALIALGLALLLYANSLSAEFVFDDDALILENPLVTGHGRVLEILGLGGRSPAYRPIRTLSYALDHAIWEGNPAGYHLSNVLYHGLTSLLVFVIARLLDLGSSTALMGMILFVVHPVHTDAVTYVSGRRDVLSTLFYLAGFAAYLVDRRRPGPMPVAWLSLCYLLAIFTKEMAVTLPVVCLAHHLTWDREPARTSPRGPLFFGALFAVGALFAYHAVYLERNVTLMPRFHGGSFWITMLTMTRAFCHYVGLLVLPLTLSADYSWNAFPLSTGLLEPRTLVAVLATVVAGMLPFAWVRRRPRLAFGLFWYWITLGPVSQVVPHTEMVAEHYLYLPSAAYCLGLGALLAYWLQLNPGVAGATALILVSSLAVRTVVRNEDWQDARTLWSATVRDHPDCARAQTNLGLVMEAEGKIPEAMKRYRIALSILPEDPHTLNNLGTLEMQSGRVKEARDLLARAVARVPGYPEALSNLGAAECELGDLASAERRIRAALVSRPDYPSALLNLGMILRRQGPSRHGEAEETYRKALTVVPSNASAYNNLGALYQDMKRDKEAANAFSKAVQLQPQAGRWRINLAVACAKLGEMRRAEEELVLAASLESRDDGFQVEVAQQAERLGLADLARRLRRRTSGQDRR